MLLFPTTVVLYASKVFLYNFLPMIQLISHINPEEGKKKLDPFMLYVCIVGHYIKHFRHA